MELSLGDGFLVDWKDVAPRHVSVLTLPCPSPLLAAALLNWQPTHTPSRDSRSLTSDGTIGRREKAGVFHAVNLGAYDSLPIRNVSQKQIGCEGKGSSNVLHFLRKNQGQCGKMSVFLQRVAGAQGL